MKYDIVVSTPENIGVVYDEDGNEVFRSRPCRLSVQARRLAQDWIDAQVGVPEGSVTLDVQGIRVNPSALF